MKRIVILIRTLLEQLQATQEQLTKAQEKSKFWKMNSQSCEKHQNDPSFVLMACNLEIEAIMLVVATLTRHYLRIAIL